MAWHSCKTTITGRTLLITPSRNGVGGRSSQRQEDIDGFY